MRAELSRAAPLALLLGMGCVAQHPSADPDLLDGAAGADAADVGPGEAPADAGALTLYDPNASVRAVAPTITVFEPDEPGEVMQGGDHQLLHLGDRYVAIWQHNQRGRVHVVARTLSPGMDPAISDLRFLTTEDPDEPRSPDSVRALWTGASLVVFMSANGGVWMREFDRELQPTSALRPVLPEDGQFTNFRAIRPADGGYHMIFASFTRGYVPQFIRLSAEGRPLGDAVDMLPMAESPSVGGLIRAPHGYSLLWAQRRAGDLDSVYLTHHTPDGRLLQDASPIYVSEHSIIQYVGPASAEAPIILIRDLDRGLLLLKTDGSAATAEVPLLAEPDDVAVAHAPDARQVALAVAAGVYRDTNPLPTHVVFHAVDYAKDTVGPPLQLSDPIEGDCLEAHAVAAAGPRLGVTWALGCSDRRLYFREVEVRP